MLPVYRAGAIDGVDLTIRAKMASLAGLLAGQTQGMDLSGDQSTLDRLAIVTP